MGIQYLWSGCPDLNRGPLRPERSALTKLRHSPSASRRKQASRPRDATRRRCGRLPGGRRAVARTAAAEPRGHHLGDPALVHLDHPELPVADVAPARPRPGCARSASKRKPPRVTYSPSGRSMPRRSRTSSTLIRPSTSQRVPSTRTIVGLVVGVELVGQVADQRLEQVLDRQDARPRRRARRPPRRRPAGAGASRPGPRGPEGLGDEIGLAEPAGDVERARGRWRPGPPGRPASAPPVSGTGR